MRRTVLFAAAALMACSPPRPEAPSIELPARADTACNTVTPDMTRAARLEGETAAIAALAPELPGGPITPGTYDLTGGSALNGAPAWPEARAVALEVRESNAGVAFHYAEARAGAETVRWSASFHQGPPAQLEFSCGREGLTTIAFAPGNDSLRLHLPDASGDGVLMLVLTRRG